MDAPPLSQSPIPVSASALIATLYQTYSHGPRAQRIDGSSMLTFDACPAEFIHAIWQHAHRRNEDEMVLIAPTSASSQSPLFGLLENFPSIDQSVVQALRVLMPFLSFMSPENLASKAHAGLSVSIGLNEQGEAITSRIHLSECPLATLSPLLDLSREEGNRSFDVFYHVLFGELDKAELLGLMAPARYALLSRSDTYHLPSWVMFADDRSLAKDWLSACEQVFSKAFFRDLIAALSGCLLLGQPNQAERAEGAALIGLDHSLCGSYPPRELISASYLAIVEAVVANLNQFLGTLDAQGQGDDAVVNSMVTIVEAPLENKHEVLSNVFDNASGINAEMASNGVQLPPTPKNVQRGLRKLTPYRQAPLTVIPDFGAICHENVGWSRTAFQRLAKNYTPLDIAGLVPSNRIWNVLSVASAADAYSVNKEAWSSSIVSEQLRDYYVTEWAEKRGTIDYTADYAAGDFIREFGAILSTGVGAGFQLQAWVEQRGYSPADFFVGNRLYLSEPVWQSIEMENSAAIGRYNTRWPGPGANQGMGMGAGMGGMAGASMGMGAMAGMPFAQGMGAQGMPQTPYAQSMYSFRPGQPQSAGAGQTQGTPLEAPRPFDRIYDAQGHVQQVDAEINSFYSDGEEMDERAYLNEFDDEKGGQHHVEVVKQTTTRKVWVSFVWILTWWIPSPLLRVIGRMKRSDMRFAWREKLVMFFLIFLLNAAIIFYMIFLGKFICPNYDKVWNHTELATHQGTDDFYVGINGHVYDLTKFYKTQHSDNGIETTSSTMLDFAGQDITDYFQPPLWLACPNLVTDDDFVLSYNSTIDTYGSTAMHNSGENIVASNTTALHNNTWYADTFQPKIKTMYKGGIVETRKDVLSKSQADGTYLFILDKKIYDVSRYMITIDLYPSSSSTSYAKYNFFDDDVVSMFENNMGEDVQEDWDALSSTVQKNTLQCLDAVFYYGEVDFRKSAKCQAANVILLVIAGVLTSITLVKFLASLRFGSKKLPSPQDRHVILQVPVYTESEDDLRLAIDSLASMDYDNTKKLMVVICDGLITGAGNDRTTPQIVLDIFGVPDRVDPEPMAYHSIAEGAKELNYAKVYSGIYEFEGNKVPFITIVKVGAPTEATRPGNRGKRDSQLILMNFLNRVHYQSPMCPLELELFHHMEHTIGVLPEHYEYLLTVDADTEVMPDALTRMVAACTADNNIAALCGETGIQNEQQSLSTMIQVYEYFISHHLTKAFESLFGSVTCLPGCFTLYRLRTQARARPLLMANEIIREYSVRHVDTLHKKNLFSLGEDRYLTTLMSKYHPKMGLRFVADAKCMTRVPDGFHVLMSQRRRWINSTVHNLAELLRLNALCGFCLFSMKGIVFADLIGTLMLPSVVIYLGYLIYVMASKTSPLPLISIVLIASVYGLQALVYIFHKRWQHIFWMIIYIAAYPFHSFILPIYSFWYMDDFGWGNTRVVVEEKQGKKVVVQDDNDVFDPRTVPMETWHSYAMRNGYSGAERPIVFDARRGRILQQVSEYFPEGNGFDRGTPFEDERTTYERSVAGPMGMGMGGAPLGARSIAPTQMTDVPLTATFNGPTLERVRRTVRQVINSSDMDNTTTRQVRDKVADLMGVELSRQKAAAVDEIIDEELDLMDDEFQPVVN